MLSFRNVVSAMWPSKASLPKSRLMAEWHREPTPDGDRLTLLWRSATYWSPAMDLSRDDLTQCLG